MGRIKRRSGGKWVDYNGLKVRKNGNFNTKATVKRRTNGKWETISETKHVTTWGANWTQSYGQDSNKKPAYADLNRLYQGHFGNPDLGWYGDFWGRQRSMIGFPTAMANELKGARIEKLELYLHIQHAWYWAGAYAAIGVHNNTSAPNKFSQERYNLKEVKYNSREEGKWIAMDQGVINMFQNGTAKGFTLFKETDNLNYYGYWYGMNDGNKKPKIRATYYK